MELRQAADIVSRARRDSGSVKPEEYHRLLATITTDAEVFSELAQQFRISPDTLWREINHLGNDASVRRSAYGRYVKDREAVAERARKRA